MVNNGTNVEQKNKKKKTFINMKSKELPTYHPHWHNHNKTMKNILILKWRALKVQTQFRVWRKTVLTGHKNIMCCPLYSLYECPIQREGLPVLCIQWWWAGWACAAGSAPNWLVPPGTKRWEVRSPWQLLEGWILANSTRSLFSLLWR